MFRFNQKTLLCLSRYNQLPYVSCSAFSQVTRKDELSFFEKMNPKKNQDLATKLRILNYIKPYILPFSHNDTSYEL